MKRRRANKEDLLGAGIFQAIANLNFGSSIDEWTFVRLIAAIEGVVKSNDDLVLKESQYKKLNRKLREKIDEFCNDEMYGLDDCKCQVLKDNMSNNKRILNGYSTKKYLRRYFDKNKISAFLNDRETDINKAINLRNTIVHEGWSSNWERRLIEYHIIGRDFLFLLILDYFDYDGDFYLNNTDQKVAMGSFKIDS